MPLRSPSVISRAPMFCIALTSARSTSGCVEPGVGSALLKLGLSRTLAPLSGLMPSRSSDCCTPAARSVVAISATRASGADSVGEGSAVGSAVGEGGTVAGAGGMVGENGGGVGGRGMIAPCCCAAGAQASSSGDSATAPPSIDSLRQNSRRFMAASLATHACVIDRHRQDTALWAGGPAGSADYGSAGAAGAQLGQ